MLNYPFIKSPNFSNRKEDVRCIIIHYTAGGNALNTTRWFANPASRVSAHFVVGRKGEIYQCVALNKVAWHAGASTIKIDDELVKNLNGCSIGIELANRGIIHKIDGKFFCKFGGDMRPYEGIQPIKAVYTGPDKRVINSYWEPYSVPQISELQKLLKCLEEEGIDTTHIFGHDEIAIPVGRKIDPGPLFPWDLFRDNGCLKLPT